ncbi:hypothetical protein PUN28_014515 [Cardiocondyla obscurior]|uniref:Odorant receptor n=1 Tax=Cardiocondyla obscurior TaxID=286306 RepID=A0AAW2F4D8_9HYME
MISIEVQYFSFNKILLFAVGLWPYQRTKLVQFRLIFFLTILITFVLFQLTAFLTLKCTSDLVVKILSTMFSYNIIITKYVSFALNMENVKKLLIQLQHVHDRLQDRYEKAIMDKYGYTGKRYTVALIIFGVFSTFIPIAVDFFMMPSGILPINNSQTRRIQYTMEYFVDQEKYITLILIHINVAFCLGLFALIASGTMFFVYFQLTCGMFKISSYRIKRAINISILENVKIKNEKVMFKGIIYAVDMHRQAMRLSNMFMSKFEITMFFLILFGVASVSLNLFQISQIGPSMSASNIKELFILFIFVVICVLYMFLANYTGQNVIDHTTNIFVTA